MNAHHIRQLPDSNTTHGRLANRGAQACYLSYAGKVSIFTGIAFNTPLPMIGS